MVLSNMRLLLTLLVLLLSTPVLADNASFEYDDNGRRDPFWPLVSENGSILSYDTDFAIGDLALEGIMAGAAGDHAAIINGRIVKSGDRLGSFTILEVQNESVIIKKDNLKFELKLEKED